MPSIRRRLPIFLLISLLTACASAQPAAPTSPLPQPVPVAESPARSPLAAPVASPFYPVPIYIAPVNTPVARKTDEPRTPIFAPSLGQQPTTTPTRIVIDFSRTTRSAVDRTSNQVSQFVGPLIDKLEEAIIITEPPLLPAELPLPQSRIDADYRLFLPLVFRQASRLSRARALYDCDQMKSIPPAECEILLLFYLDTNGPQWREQRKWLTGANPCWWGDLQCFGGHVRVLQVENNRLTGVLPPEISQLNLTFLLLKGNQIGGPVPDYLGRMKELEAVDLSGNQLTGRLSPDVLRLSNLRALAFDRTKIWFDTNLFACTLETIPTAECETLVSIYREMNGESWNVAAASAQNPGSPGKPYADEWLIGPDPCLWKGIRCVEKHLDIIDLHDSNLSGPISSDFAKLVHLGQLDLSYNYLYGSVPLEFKNLTNLKRLHLAGNQRPPEVANDPTADLCVPGAVVDRLGNAINLENMPPGSLCD